MLRSIVVAAIVAVAPSTAHAQTAPSTVPGGPSSLPIGAATPPANIPTGAEQTVNRAAVAKAVIEARGYREVKTSAKTPSAIGRARQCVTPSRWR